jgi:serine/threonine-protein kinase PknG
MFLMMNFDFMGRDRFITSSEGWNRLVSEQEVSAQATGQVNPLSSKSLVSFLKRATAIDPADRFQSAIEMAEQGWLVMREIVAAKTGLVKQIESTLFDGDSSGGRTTPDWRLLPGLKLDNDDPARGEIETALKSVKNDKDLKATLDAAALKYPKSREVQLRLALVLIKLNDATTAERKLIQLGGDDTEDFRPLWYRGILALARGNAKEAVQWFSDVVYMVPGETVPKLALGMAAELSGDDVTAIESYDSVTIVEPNHTLAAFGHARALSREGSREKAFKALKRVPVSSIAHRAAELQAVKVLISTNPDLPGMAEFQKAAEILESLRDGSYEWHKLVSEFYLALQKSIAGKVIAEDKKTLMLGASLTTRALGFKAHDELMSASHYAPEKATELRNQALLVRPVTLW